MTDNNNKRNDITEMSIVIQNYLVTANEKENLYNISKALY